MIRKKGFTWRDVGEPQTDQHAVGNITWNDAVAFCNWLSQTENLKPCYQKGSNEEWAAFDTSNGYRLPTEAEWEFACRAGTQTEFSWGDDRESPRRKEHAQTEYGTGGQMRIFPVGQKKPNAFGCSIPWATFRSGVRTAGEAIRPSRNAIRTSC